MAFQIGAIGFNQSNGVGEGLNAAAQNFLRAYQIGKERRLREQQARIQEQQAGLQTQAMQREAAMAPLREAIMRSQAFQAGVKPAETAVDTTFNLPTLTGAIAPVVNAPAFTMSRDQRFVPLGGGQLPISDVSDATQANVPERGGFVFDTLDNPIARARNDQERQMEAQREAAMAAARQQLQMLYTREGLAGERQNAQNQFTARQNALNRANARDLAMANRQNSREVAAIRSGNANGLQRPQEFNMKAAMVTPRAEEAGRIIDELGTPATLAAKGFQKVPVIGQYFTSDEQQRLQQAGEVFATAVLRLESGAAVSKQEAQSYAKQFIPQPGDTQKVLEEKARLRAIQLERLRAASAPVTAREQGAQASEPGGDAVAPAATANASEPDSIREAALARAMALRFKAQGLTNDQIVAKLRDAGFEVVP
jgi:hypothetical protein